MTAPSLMVKTYLVIQRHHCMDFDGRVLNGVIIVVCLYWLMGGTVIYALRRRRQIEPPWTWLKSMAAYFAIEVLAGVTFVVPVAGFVLRMLIFYAGFKYSTGLGFVRTLLLGLAMLILMLALTSLVGFLLGVDLNEIWAELGKRPY